MSLSAAQLVAMTPGRLALESAETLRQAKETAADLVSRARAVAEHVDRAVDIKYAQIAQQRRLDAGKDTGTVTFDDGDVRIAAELPKKVEWDQAVLRNVVERIRAGGGDPNEYVEATYRVSETKYNAWPEHLRSAFAPARTLKTGRPSFRLTPSSGDA